MLCYSRQLILAKLHTEFARLSAQRFHTPARTAGRELSRFYRGAAESPMSAYARYLMPAERFRQDKGQYFLSAMSCSIIGAEHRRARFDDHRFIDYIAGGLRLAAYSHFASTPSPRASSTFLHATPAYFIQHTPIRCAPPPSRREARRAIRFPAFAEILRR